MRLSGFYYGLENGYNTVVGRAGAYLSGGEKQRVSIVKAIMKNAPIIILDEATANVDAENEKELTEAIEALTKEKTILIIAHRLKTVRNADNILIFFVAYPNWCETLPMCMLTFLDNYSLSGKLIAPLCTNEGSGMGKSEAHLQKLYPDAKFYSGLSVKGCRVAEAETEQVISDWAVRAANRA